MPRRRGAGKSPFNRGSMSERLEPRRLLSAAVVAAPALSTGSISGVVFSDANGNGIQDAGEPGLSNWTVFLDANQNGTLDRGEQTATTDTSGHYAFTNLTAGTYFVDEVPLPGYTQTSPGGSTTAAWKEVGPDGINSIPNGGLPDIGRISGRVVGIAPSPTDANTIYIAAAGGGVWKTTNAGSAWTPLTDSQATTAMGSIAVAPSNPNVIYAGTGESNFSADNQYGRGILKSTDGGATWTLLGTSDFDRLAISKIVVDPNDPNVVYAGVGTARLNAIDQNQGVWKSIDGGVTWTNLTDSDVGSTTTEVTDLVMDPANSQELFAGFGAVDGDAANGVWETNDGGASWTRINLLPTGTAAGRVTLTASSDGQTLYAAFSDPTDAKFGHLLGLYRSDDAGATWSQQTSTPDYMAGVGWYATALAVDPANANRVYAASTGDYGQQLANAVIRSDDGGGSWTNIGADANDFGPHPDNHVLVFDAAGNLWDGNDGGVYETADQGNTWTDRNGNLSLTQLNGIAINPANSKIIFGGSQDNGTEKTNGSNVWTEIDAGDGGQVRYDPASGTVYHSFFYVKGDDSSSNFFQRSDNNGFGFVAKTFGIDTQNDNGLFYPPYVMDPSNASRLVLGTDKVYVTSNRGDSWTPMSGVLGAANTVITAVAVATSDPNTIYVTYSDDSVWVTHDDGQSWKSATGNLPTSPATAPPQIAVAPAATSAGASDPNGGDDLARFLTGQHGSDGFIAVDPANSSVAYLVRNVFGNGHVYRTTDGGSTWTNISGNLPDIPAHTLALDPRNSPATMYLGTDAGVYISTNGGTSWSLFGTGLPNTLVSDLQISTAGNFLDAATYGRGVWQVPLTASVGPREYTVFLSDASPSAMNINFGNLAGFPVPTTVSGTAFIDTNGNGVLDAGEPPLAGETVYLDLNADGGHELGEPTAITDSSGNYAFSGLAPGTYSVRSLGAPGFFFTSLPLPVTVSATAPTAVANVGNFPTVFSGSAGAADAWYLRRDPSSATPLVQFFNSTQPTGTPAYTLPLSFMGGTVLQFNLGGGGDTLTLDFSDGDITRPTSNPIVYTAGAGTNTIAFIGSSGDDAFSASIAEEALFTDGATGTQVPIKVASVQAIQFHGGSGGSDRIDVTNGAFTIDADTPIGTPDVSVSDATPGSPITFATTQRLAALTLTGGATATVSAGAASNGKTLFVNSLAIDATSTLDLTNNELQLRYTGPSPVATIRNLLHTGGANPAHSGPGLVSSVAPAGFALGYADDGTGTITVKYTRLGDATLDGAVTFADLLVLAQNYGKTATATWDQGDFNYDGSVTFADLLALAQNYNASALTAFPAVTASTRRRHR